MQVNHIVLGLKTLSGDAKVCWGWLLAEAQCEFYEKRAAEIGVFTLSVERVKQEDFTKRHYQELVDNNLLRMTRNRDRTITFELYPPPKGVGTEKGNPRGAAVGR